MELAIERTGAVLARSERILVITGAGLSADSGMPTYRGLGGLYNGRTVEGVPIESALSGPMLRDQPGLCWKYLAELGRACLGARPNAGHDAIAELQRRKPQCWVLTQNIDGFHRQAGSPAQRLIEIHGELAPLYCQSCGQESAGLAEHLSRPLPPKCARCAGVLRPPVVLFEEMLPEAAIDTLYTELRKGFDAVLLVGTTASFPYIIEPVLRTKAAGGFTAEVNPGLTDLSPVVEERMVGRALDILPRLLSHIPR
ncbi:NAD-dependent protein deacylase [Pseudomonas sp. ZM23]|uniref:protein acetyllysine N-acetyltransferase n=1 Tax=Pseudomonas triclosanedens TaxID=2961893 RepID=A0ABY7A512_9PSED|nr:NAD-dependent protein deacylase [Pseudomonas triclosanedens]MCP8464299.1 NAD-dependent protein deacylase [Pseudomonas triclosanedens]MCP8471433.1 NAD-dependent protein deacylase [Pseudomonas triclosanedens]MCP8477758.1 NAD-dependent protein deacylase [Pseudomonas triclosanedens]WAI51213.1 NAD-dependent protein deacylase [Pseudomonas triclosanedens]